MPTVNPMLYHARPEVETGRPAMEIHTYDILDKLHIPFLRIDHDALYTMKDCSYIDAMLGTEVCKNLFLCNSQKTSFYLLMMPGTKKFKTSVFSKQIGSSRLSFAPPEYMHDLLGLAPGSVTILGLIHDTKHRVRLYMDKTIAESTYLGCHPCTNTASLRIKTQDIFEKFLPFTGHTAEFVELPDDPL